MNAAYTCTVGIDITWSWAPASTPHFASGRDLIIVSKHARHGVERLALGSVAEGVIEEAKVPVIVIKPPVHIDQAKSEERLRTSAAPRSARQCEFGDAFGRPRRSS